MRMKRFCVVLMLVAVVLTSGQVRAQDSEIITVTGLYVSYPPGGEYQETLTPCDRLEVWDVVSTGAAFTALAQAYASAETSGQLSKYDPLFVELRGRHVAYTGESHSDGLFVITEFVRSSTAAADITSCEWTCERVYGAGSPTCLAQEDGQCGSTRNSCVAGGPFDHEMANLADTATEYRWLCLGAYGGDNSAVCTAPKAVLRGTEDREQK